MSLSRRSFFSGTLAFTALAILPTAVKALARPAIFCDGIHCDADGLEAIMEGRPFEIAEGAMGTFQNHGEWIIRNGLMSIRRTLCMRGHKGTFENGALTMLPDFQGDCMVSITDDCASFTFKNCTLSLIGPSLAHQPSEQQVKQQATFACYAQAKSIT